MTTGGDEQARVLENQALASKNNLPSLEFRRSVSMFSGDRNLVDGYNNMCIQRKGRETAEKPRCLRPWKVLIDTKRPMTRQLLKIVAKLAGSAHSVVSLPVTTDNYTFLEGIGTLAIYTQGCGGNYH